MTAPMRRVLVVDDNVRLANTVTTYLNTQHFETTAANSAEEAMAAVMERDFDVAVLDINMPGADGFELCQRIRDEKPAVKVVMLSGRQGEGDEDRAKDAGAEMLMYKPISLALLAGNLKGLFTPVR